MRDDNYWAGQPPTSDNSLASFIDYPANTSPNKGKGIRWGIGRSQRDNQNKVINQKRKLNRVSMNLTIKKKLKECAELAAKVQTPPTTGNPPSIPYNGINSLHTIYINIAC